MSARPVPTSRRFLLLTPAVAVAVTAAGCGASASGMAGVGGYPPVTPGPAAPGARNDVDVMFAGDMIPHYGQAVQMAGMILARTTNPQVKVLRRPHARLGRGRPAQPAGTASGHDPLRATSR